MAIGTLAAVALGAGAIGSAVLGKSATNTATKAATQAADQSAAVQREQLAVAQNALNPYVQGGQAANQQINALLGLTPTQSYQTTGTQQPNALAQMGGGDPSQNPAYQPYVSEFTNPHTGQVNWGALQSYVGDTGWQQPQQQPQTVNAPASQDNPWDGFKSYLAGSDYAFQFGQGANRVNSGYAGAGTLQSGAAMKALEGYRQNLQSGYRGEYMNALGNQQGVGLSGASALAGVGQNYANSLGSINASKADAIGNAALANASNMNGLIGGLSSGILYNVGRK